MTQHTRLGTSARLALAFGTVAAIGLGISAYSLSTMKSLDGKVDELAHNRLVKIAEFSEMLDNFDGVARSARNYLISDDKNFQAGEREKIRHYREKNAALLVEFDKVIVIPRGKELLKTIEDNRGQFVTAVDKALELADQGNKAEAGKQLLGPARELQHVIFKAVMESRDMQQDMAKELARESEATVQTAMSVMGVLALLMAVIGGAVAWVTARGLRKALGAEPAELADIVNRVADSDLSQPLSVPPDAPASVMAAVARMQSSLSQVVATVRQGAESVASASSQIAHGNQDLSQRTEEQASALQQTAAAMDELGSTVRHNADNAGQADQLAQGASSVAVRGGSVVQQVVNTMQGMEESSRKISDIIGTIDG
ncbi:MCP four helix bundle domain-containing protein, partial [Azohydromonas lata]|uniref:MCP four helix bundle domain-containing protein n=1 Tax=Azohydromonas lata TaxID=45677 RepID=UPI001EE4C4BD